MSQLKQRFLESIQQLPLVNMTVVVGDTVQQALGKLQAQLNNVSPAAPITIAAGKSFLIPANSQVLFTIPINLQPDSFIEFMPDGALVEVN